MPPPRLHQHHDAVPLIALNCAQLLQMGGITSPFLAGIICVVLYRRSAHFLSFFLFGVVVVTAIKSASANSYFWRDKKCLLKIEGEFDAAGRLLDNELYRGPPWLLLFFRAITLPTFYRKALFFQKLPRPFFVKNKISSRLEPAVVKIRLAGINIFFHLFFREGSFPCRFL